MVDLPAPVRYVQSLLIQTPHLLEAVVATVVCYGVWYNLPAYFPLFENGATRALIISGILFTLYRRIDSPSQNLSVHR